MPKGSDDVIESEPKHKVRIVKTRNISILVIALIYAVVLIIVALRLRTTYIEVHVGSTTINAAISNTDKQRLQGLSGTKYIGVNNGMLFVFQNTGEYGFWMKDMNYNLDIIWLSNSKRVNYIAKNLSPKSYPEVFFPNSPSQYVLEVNAGTVNRLHIQLGEQISF